MDFYKNILGMKVLRHEEFEKGCEAMCNGPYDGKWSKTMIGYGAEDAHFVLELTYNYNISSYKLGNDFQGITIESSEALARAKTMCSPSQLVEVQEDRATVVSPSGYKFILLDKAQPANRDPVVSVGISVADMTRSVDYWSGLLGMQVTEDNENLKGLQFGPNQAKLFLQDRWSGGSCKSCRKNSICNPRR